MTRRGSGGAGRNLLAFETARARVSEKTVSARRPSTRELRFISTPNARSSVLKCLSLLRSSLIATFGAEFTCGCSKADVCTRKRLRACLR